MTWVPGDRTVGDRRRKRSQRRSLTHHGVHLLHVVAVEAVLAGADEGVRRGQGHMHVQEGEKQQERASAVPADTAATSGTHSRPPSAPTLPRGHGQQQPWDRGPRAKQPCLSPPCRLGVRPPGRMHRLGAPICEGANKEAREAQRVRIPSLRIYEMLGPRPWEHVPPESPWPRGKAR